jgi:uncharacterized protein (TIGR02246 family)
MTKRFALFGMFLLLVPNALRAQQGETAAILQTVDSLFLGMKAKDTALVRRVFEPGARLVGMRPRGLQVLTVDQFVTFIARDTRGEWVERAFDPEVRFDRTLATVWAQYDFHLGGQATHCGIDAVQLLKIGESWRIVGLADTYIVEGCPPRPALGAESPAGGSSSELGRAMKEMEDAWNRNDLAGHVAPYADSAVFMIPRGPLIGRDRIRASLERSFWVNGKPKQQLRFEEVEVRMLGPLDARVMGKFILTGGGMPEATGRFTTIWEKIDGRWQIIHDHSS